MKLMEAVQSGQVGASGHLRTQALKQVSLGGTPPSQQACRQSIQHSLCPANDMEIISELVYLKCLRLEKCSVEELPSSISNLRNLEILDMRRSKVRMFRNVLWKLKHQ
ncbi:hypothetical protein POM88_033186 [Heracleum sosnowskyi]|uniref:Uncharacterized protein n=1 Tax=Heracleum sosnowskyi TaxID=360622 RepID=A0AAD8I334_9APIA|nr:hypothetical protein POM88_033186 [Heracleum sosnowskyi]